MYIGEKVKELRRIQRLSLSELAQKSGVQIATLSRIEHQKMTGTLESHIKIAQALGVDVTVLYSSISETPVHPDNKGKKAQSEVFIHSDRSSYEILTSKVLIKRMMPILLKIDPEGSTNREENPKGSEKFIFVLDGKVEVKVDGESYQLGKNNSLYFDASKPHKIVNLNKTPAKLICVTTPVHL